MINETYSAFVQGFMPTLARPEVDVLEGLTAAIIVDQERMGANSLLGLLDRLVDSGKSVIVIEHHQSVMAHADWIIDFGPGAGHDGGRIVFDGTPPTWWRRGPRSPASTWRHSSVAVRGLPRLAERLRLSTHQRGPTPHSSAHPHLAITRRSAACGSSGQPRAGKHWFGASGAMCSFTT